MALIVRYQGRNSKTHIARDEEETFCGRIWKHSSGTMTDPRQAECEVCELKWRSATNLEKRKADAVRSKVTPTPRQPILTEEVIRGEEEEPPEPRTLVMIDTEALIRVVRRCLTDVELLIHQAKNPN